jgi:hypothetical protein
MIEQQAPVKVSLEDLLRVKRAERPPAEFWSEFDRNLHAKQLAAIVDKRPWWRVQSWKQTTRWSLPLTAAAVLAITLVTVAHPALSKNRAVKSPSAQAVALVTHFERVSATLAPVVDAPPALIAISEPIAVKDEKPAVQNVAAAEVSPASPLARTSSLTEQIAGLAISAESDSPTAHFSAVSAKDGFALPDLGAFFDKAVAHLDPNSRTEKVAMVEPLSQVQTPREVRRARLVAMMSLPSYSDQTAEEVSTMRSRERIASHLNEEALYDSISRLGVKGNRVSIQF